MSTNTRPSASGAEKSYFEQQREILLSEIAVVRVFSFLSFRAFSSPLRFVYGAL
jgi:hypothetical protein